VRMAGYMGEERRPVSTYNAHQDEFGFKEGNDYPASGGGFGDHKHHRPDVPSSTPGEGYGRQGVEHGYGDQSEETFQDAPERMTGYGDTDNGVGGPKSGYGDSREGTAYDRATDEQTQFGVGGKENSYGLEGSDPQLGGTDTSSYAAVDPQRLDSDRSPISATETIPGGDGWGPEDTSRTHGAKKDGLMNKIKEKLPGHHNTAQGEVCDPNAPPKKGMMEKIKEKLPGHDSGSAGM